MSRDDYQFNPATPAFFVQGPSLFARFVFMSVLSLALIVTDSRLHYLKAFRSQVETYLHPLSLLTNAPFELYSEVDSYFQNHNQLLAENKMLRGQLLKSHVDAQSVRALKLENKQLRDLTSLQERLQQKQMLAEILHATSNQSIREVIINRGKAHHVELGAAVIDAQGVLGQVTRIYPQTSVVTMITNPGMEIPVMVARNGIRAIAFGRGQDNRLEIPFLPSNIDIKVGDDLITSGIDYVYPPGFAIGKVERIKVESGAGYIRIECSIAGGVELNRHVIVANPLPEATLIKDGGTKEEAPSGEEATDAEKQAVNSNQESYMSQGVIRVSE